MDRGAWWAAVHGVAKSWRRLSEFTFTFHFHALEKEMATHSSVLARDRGAWWAVVYGVAQSRTRLKRLSSSSRNTKLSKGFSFPMVTAALAVSLKRLFHLYHYPQSLSPDSLSSSESIFFSSHNTLSSSSADPPCLYLQIH